MLTTKDIERLDEMLEDENHEILKTSALDADRKWAADQLKKADAFNKELLQQIYQLRQTLKMVL